jgi:FkbM family methyltransferase
VGCNKGFDALNLLRIGTKQTAIRKQAWKAELGRNVEKGVCNQENEPDLPISDGAKEIPGEVHCIEPMPLTVQALRRAANTTGYDKKGFRLVQAALANEIGTVPFPSAQVLGKGHNNVMIGTENRGISNTKVTGVDKYEDVDLLTLDEYSKRHLPSEGHIHVLLTDVEGFDFDVLKGGSETLSRVEYVEFEYNWKGNWEKQELHDAVDYMNGKGFTCYWAGRRKLWRLTSCWLDHYKSHNWSNVACVHRRHVPELAARMEQVFLATLHDNATSS